MLLAARCDQNMPPRCTAPKGRWGRTFRRGANLPRSPVSPTGRIKFIASTVQRTFNCRSEALGINATGDAT